MIFLNINALLRYIKSNVSVQHKSIEVQYTQRLQCVDLGEVHVARDKKVAIRYKNSKYVKPICNNIKDESVNLTLLLNSPH